MDHTRFLPQAGHWETEAVAKVLARMRYKIFVMSGKGGVGKSSVSVNLAVILAEMGYKTGLLDVDIHGPSVPRLLGIQEGIPTGMESSLLRPLQVGKNLRVLSLDALLPDRDKAVIWRGPKKNGAIRQLLGEAEWGDLDFFLIDSPPGTGDEHLAVLRMIPEVLCLVVTTSHQVALADVRKAVSFLRSMRVEPLGLVENMSVFPCPYCKREILLNPPGGALDLARKANIAFLGSIPFDAEACQAAGIGKTAPDLPVSNLVKSAYYALAESIKNICFSRRGKE